MFRTIILTEDGKCLVKGYNNSITDISKFEEFAQDKIIYVTPIDSIDIIFTNDKKCYALIYNSDTRVFKVQLILTGNSSHILKVTFNDKHTFVLTSDGKLYCCYNATLFPIASYKTLLHASYINLSTDIDDPIIDITNGYKTSIAITKKNKYYVWGINDNGQLGILNTTSGSKDNNFRHIIEPMELSPFKSFKSLQVHIKKVYCGHNHTICTTNTKTSYGFGSNINKQIHSVNQDNILEPMALEYPGNSQDNHFVSFVCGPSHTFGKTASDLFYFRGNDRLGQSGLQIDNILYISSWAEIKCVDPEDNYQKIKCVANCVYGRTRKGVCYAWGNNQLGQLFLNNSDSKLVYHKQTKMDIQSPIALAWFRDTAYVQLEWPKVKVLILGLTDKASIISRLPREILYYIMRDLC